MKIIIAHYKYYVQGGPERYMLKFMELARNHNCEIIPFSVDYEQNINSEYSDYFVSPAKRDKSAMFRLRDCSPKAIALTVQKLFKNREAYEKLRALIAIEKPDVLYCLIPGWLSSEIFRAAAENNIPIILRVSDFRLICGNNTLLRNGDICEECIHGNYSCMQKHKCVKNSFILSTIRKLQLEYERKHETYQCIDAVITPPQFTANKFIESGYFPKEKVHVNPTFLDASDIAPNYKHQNYVLCLGRFSSEKGFIHVIEALKYLKDLPVKVAVTGSKENCDPQMKALMEQYHLEDKIDFVGFVHGEQLEKLTAEAMCVACPAIWYENLPNTVIEAYAYGKPVIASNLGSLAEIVEDGKTGLLFEPKDAEQIAECIRKLYENPKFTEELGRNARKKCEDDFSPEKHWKKFEKIYQSVKMKGEN